MNKSTLAAMALSAMSLTAMAQANYPVNYPADATITNAARSLVSVTLKSPTHGEQVVNCNQTTDRLLYHDCTGQTLKAVAGEVLVPTFQWTGTWMHGYVYLDRGNDGKFDAATVADPDLITFSNYEGVNAIGTATNNGNVGVNPPAFILPSDLAPGTYRLRFKVDWNSIDPAGSTREGQDILSNGGAITDVTLKVEAAPQSAAGTYAVNFPTDAVITHDERRLGSVTLTSGVDGAQTLAVGQDTDRLLYHDLTGRCFSAAAGESVAVTFGWTGTWMHGYVYLDRGNDGVFSSALGDNSSRPVGSDVMAFSNYNGYNSAGTVTSDGNVGVNPPSFVLPASLAPGLYRMRFKVDWNSIDPGGNPGQDGNNTIVKNGGAIADAMIYVHPAAAALTVTATDGGDLTDAHGTALAPNAVVAGQPLTVYVNANTGYRFDGLVVNSGYALPENSKAEFADPSLALKSHVVPSFAMGADGRIDIPAELLRGQVEITPHFVSTESGGTGTGTEQGIYECSLTGTKPATEGFATITLDGNSPLAVTSPRRYFLADSKALAAMPGDVKTLRAAYSGPASRFNLYVDYDQNGVFTAEGSLSSELVATASTADGLPSFTIPAVLGAGVYRARLEAEGHSAVDFLINVHLASGALDVKALNGQVMGSTGPLPLTIDYGTRLPIKPSPTLPGFKTNRVIVRHGHNLNGPAYINGNRQWADTVLTYAANVTIPADVVDGDVDIYVLYAELDDSEWTKVWGDEFSGDKLDTKRWSYQERYSATWNRLVAQGTERPLVNKIANGHYESYCIPTPAKFTSEDQPMISGAIQSQGKFYTTYGKVEARVKTRRHTGNFPAFWMMPQKAPLGWPKDGEIDIWEQIDDTHRAHHTVHTGWTGWLNYCHYTQAPKQWSPQNTGNTTQDMDVWHVYAVEWDDDALRFSVDGTVCYTYPNMHYDETPTDPSSPYSYEITWPFNHDFYVILNQSVGNGSWAKQCDPTFEYLTEFDYVRVYKKKGDNGYYTKLKDNGDDPDFYVEAQEPGSYLVDVVDDTMNPDDAFAPAEYFDLQGRRVANPRQGGVYIVRRGNTSTKTLIH